MFSLSSATGLLTVGLLSTFAFAQNGTSTNGSSLATLPIYQNVPAANVENAEAIAAINQALSLYSIALDTKNFTALSGVFTEDVVAYIAPGSAINGRAAYEKFLASDLSPYKTQHLTNTVFAYNIKGTTAESVSYQQAIYIGTGSLLGQVVTFYERFDDSWRRVEGRWKSFKRTIDIFVSQLVSKTANGLFRL